MNEKAIVCNVSRPVALATKNSLNQIGIDMEFVECRKSLVDKLARRDYQLAVIGSLSSEINGLGICNKLRSLGFEIPIIALVESRDLLNSMNIVMHGVDDYIASPYSYSELAARAKRLIHRPPGHRIESVSKAGIVYNKTDNQFSDEQGTIISLPSRQFSILKLLFDRFNRPVPRSMIYSRLSSGFKRVSESAIDVHVSQIRKSISHLSQPHIESVYGIGYRLTANLG